MKKKIILFMRKSRKKVVAVAVVLTVGTLLTSVAFAKSRSMNDEIQSEKKSVVTEEQMAKKKTEKRKKQTRNTEKKTNKAEDTNKKKENKKKENKKNENNENKKEQVYKVGELSSKELKELVALFSQDEKSEVRNIYPQALTSYYKTPKEMNLFEFFHFGTESSDTLPATEEERAYLEGVLDYEVYGIARAVPSEIDEVLRTYFGIALADANTESIPQGHYYEPTDSYLFTSTETNTPPVEFTGAYRQENGDVELYYTNEWTNTKSVVVLHEQDNQWQIKSNMPIEEETEEATSENAQDETTQRESAECESKASEEKKSESVVDVRWEEICTDAKKYAVFTALDEKGNTVWSYTTEKYPITEAVLSCPIGINGACYYHTENGTVVARNLTDGSILWENKDFGGQNVVSAFGTDGTIYLSGYWNPDFCAIDKNGKTLAKIEALDKEYPIRSGMQLKGDVIELTMATDPVEDITALYRVNLNDYFYEKVE